MGVTHSRAGDATLGADLRRRCFSCDNGQQSLDAYEPTDNATATPIHTAMAGSSLDKPVVHGNQPIPVEPEIFCIRENCDNLEQFPYSNFTQETLLQIIRCFPFGISLQASGVQPHRSQTSSSAATSGVNNHRHHNANRPVNVDASGRQVLLQRVNDRNNNKNRVDNGCRRHKSVIDKTEWEVSRTSPVWRSQSAIEGKRCKVTGDDAATAAATAAANQMNGQARQNHSIRTAPMNTPGNHLVGSAVEALAMVSVDTMAITALPLNCWLRERLKRWVQLSGHEGTIVPASDQTLWKRRSHAEYDEGYAYRELMSDPLLVDYVPRFHREVEHNGESFIEIDDLTALFNNPAIMDIKIGIRTFMESEVVNSCKRSDLYQKMIALNPSEPTAEEHAEKAITKMRYMQFREKESSSFSFGYRIEAAKMPSGMLEKNFKKVRSYDESGQTLWKFFGDHPLSVATCFLERLKQLRKAVEKSEFFRTHEVIGSSLLFIYDAKKANIWMIDFAKSLPVERDSVDHRRRWEYGNHEDGYLFGLDNLIMVINDLIEIHPKS